MALLSRLTIGFFFDFVCIKVNIKSEDKAYYPEFGLMSVAGKNQIFEANLILFFDSLMGLNACYSNRIQIRILQKPMLTTLLSSQLVK